MNTKKEKKQRSFNAFDVIAESFTSLKRKQTKAFLGSVFMLALVSLVFGIIYGISNSFIIALIAVSVVYGILLIPYINFMCNVAEGRGALEDMFQRDQYTLSNILIGFVFSALVLFGTVLFVVPAFVFITLFILVLPIASNTTSKCFDAFQKAKDLSKGYRGRILAVVLIYVLILAACVGAGIGISALVFNLIFKMPLWWIIGLMVGTLAFLIFFMPYATLSVVYLYDNTIAEKNDKNNGGNLKFEEDDNAVLDVEPQEEIKVIEAENKGNRNPFDYSDFIRY